MIEFVTFCILFFFLSLLGIGFWFYFIIQLIPEMFRSIKWELNFETYFLTVVASMISIFIVGGIPFIMYQIWGPFRAHVYKVNVSNKFSDFKSSRKVIQYDVPQEVRVDSDFIHNDKVIHRESN